jgi:hypothetical protein
MGASDGCPQRCPWRGRVEPGAGGGGCSDVVISSWVSRTCAVTTAPHGCAMMKQLRQELPRAAVTPSRSPSAGPAHAPDLQRTDPRAAWPRSSSRGRHLRSRACRSRLVRWLKISVGAMATIWVAHGLLAPGLGSADARHAAFTSVFERELRRCALVDDDPAQLRLCIERAARAPGAAGPALEVDGYRSEIVWTPTARCRDYEGDAIRTPYSIGRNKVDQCGRGDDYVYRWR